MARERGASEAIYIKKIFHLIMQALNHGFRGSFSIDEHEARAFQGEMRGEAP
jgi:hypothetical protein